MREAPERIWAVPEYNCTVYMSGNSPITAQTGPFEHRLHGHAAAYVRADLSDALLREAWGALDAAAEALDWALAEISEYANIMSRDPGAVVGIAATAADEARATLAKLRAHLGETD